MITDTNDVLIDKGAKGLTFNTFFTPITMSLLSKSEILFLQGQKQVSKSYEYKAKTLFFLAHEDTTLFPDIGLTNRSMPGMSRCDPLEQPQRLQAMASENRLNGNDPYEQ